MIEQVQVGMLRGYAEQDFAPIADLDVHAMVACAGGRLHVDELGAHTQELAVPGIGGETIIIVNRYIPPAYRRLAVRHGLAHLLAGDVSMEDGRPVRFLATMQEYMTRSERMADLFALADLVPDWQLDEIATSTRPAEQLLSEIERFVRDRVRATAPDWPARRVRDRARLRVDLYVDRRE